MKIEDFWADIDIYHVSFEVKKEVDNLIGLRMVNKTIVLPSGMTEEEVISIVTKRFSEVKTVQAVDYWEEALLLKE
ncbi:hypothetical protein MX629_00110 [Carnobacterium divergens]|uniref:Uncharacterized protein n=1 Tax=Carnobacterium divergens TaxID=2748 RepID=A0AAW8R5T4_CARDV|nr:hypothetical protein [Carnobacterium divergens]MDT1956822.1 hypothetical protein [Carnobacterium divergens]MDT1972792.1 hypothetical protein [Carnobacterium divergens]